MSRSFFFFFVFKYSCGGERFTSRISVSERIFNSTLYAITSVIQLMTCFLKFQKYDFWNKRMIHTTTSDGNTLSLSSWNTGEDKHWKVHLTSTLLNGRGRGLLHFAGASFPVGKQRSSKLSHQVNRKKKTEETNVGLYTIPPSPPSLSNAIWLFSSDDMNIHQNRSHAWRARVPSQKHVNRSRTAWTPYIQTIDKMYQ